MFKFFTKSLTRQLVLSIASSLFFFLLVCGVLITSTVKKNFDSITTDYLSTTAEKYAESTSGNTRFVIHYIYTCISVPYTIT